jgi:ribosomal protein S12 methylthiotransferase accessory factor
MDTQKHYTSGTHRTVAPAVTLQRIQPLMATMGITRIANVTGLDDIGIPVVMVCRPNSRSIAVSQGKGLDLIAAKVSGLMESVEAYHAERITLPTRFASYADLSHDHLLADIAGLPASKRSIYHDHLPLLWLQGHDLIGDTPLWLPYELISTDYTLPLPPGSGCFNANSNGLASGNHYLEALAHGLYEVIERDAVALWKLHDEEARRSTVIDPETIDDGACRMLLEKFERAAVDVKIWEVTSDIGIAAFFCLIMGRSDATRDPEFGAGCHPARQIALARALTEAAQARTTFIAGSRDDFTRQQYQPAARQRRFLECRRLIRTHRPQRSFQQVPDWQAQTLEADLDRTLQRLQAAGIRQVIAVDLSKPQLQIPVVRVVVPGLEGAYQSEDSDYRQGRRARAVIEGRV